MTNPDRYDFVVIGAGCLLINHLSVDPDDKVSLLEAILAQDVMIMNPARLFTGRRHGAGLTPHCCALFSGARRSGRAIM
jgi:hypothetical protein